MVYQLGLRKISSKPQIDGVRVYFCAAVTVQRLTVQRDASCASLPQSCVLLIRITVEVVHKDLKK